MLLGWMDLTFPCFLIWPERTEAGSFWLLDCTSAGFYDLRATRSIENLGLEHFFAAFGLWLKWIQECPSGSSQVF